MKTIGFISQKTGYLNNVDTSYCGVGIRGKLLSDVLSKFTSEKYKFVSGFIDNNIDLEKFIIENNPKMIIYNYHFMTTGWMNDRSLRNKYHEIIHVSIQYDLLQKDIDNFDINKFEGFKYIITDNETLKVDNIHFFSVTRCIPSSDDIPIEYNRKDNIPIIGFQGFGLPHKGIWRIAYKIQEEFDEAIFRIHIPFSYYMDKNGHNAALRVQEVRNIIKKPGIKLEISHDFLSDEEIVKWLNKNTINCYFFDYLETSGIATSPDYAIAARRPIAVNNSKMLLNLQNLNPCIEIEKNTLKNIINNDIEPLIPLYEKYKQINVFNGYINICDKLILI